MIGFAGAAGAAGFVAQSLGDAPALAPFGQKAIEEKAREFMERFKVPGLSVAFAREGKVVLSRGFGVADQTTGAPVTSDHLFHIASVSKPITSVAIFSLIEQGRLALDDLVLGNKGRLGFDFGKTLPETAGHPARGNVQDDDHAHRRGRTIRRGWAVNKVPDWWHNSSLPGTASILVRTAGGFCRAALTNSRGDGVGPALDQMIWKIARAVPEWRA